MTNAPALEGQNLALACEYQQEYAALRQELMEAAFAACRRNHSEPGGFLGAAYDAAENAARTRINDVWPRTNAWYLYKGMIYPSWINRETGDNYMEIDIKRWNAE